MERIKWKLFLRWSYTKYRIKTANLKVRIWVAKVKTKILNKKINDIKGDVK